MPAINKFYQFATLASSDNILSDGQYEADDQRLSGNVPGIARQQLVNKCLKQAAAIAYAFGEAASVNNNMEVSDDGAGLTNITDYLTKALLPGYSASDANKYARINSQGTGIVYVTIPPASTTVAGLTRYATTTEANAGTIADAAVTPAGLKAFSDGHQNITGNAATASKLQTARTIGLSGVTATAQSFNGSANIEIPISAIPATLLTGTIAAARLPQATEAVIGGARIATTAEATAGTDNTTIMTPAKVKAYVDTSVGGSFTAATFTEKLQLLTTSEASLDVNFVNGNVVAFTLTRDITLLFTALAPPSVSQSRTVSFIITNGGAFSITWPSNITWLNGTAPTLKASGIDIVTLISPNEGINWYAAESGGGGGVVNSYFKLNQDGQVALKGNFLVTGDMSITGNIIPSANASKDLGSASLKWNYVYGVEFSGNAATASIANKATAPNYQDIPAYTDLNNIKNPGWYCALGNENAETLSNRPPFTSSSTAFGLEVSYTLNTTGFYISQSATGYHNGEVFSRLFFDDTTWTAWKKTIKDTDVLVGATASANGTAGLVPAPATTDVAKFLRGDGTWAESGGGGGTVITVSTSAPSGGAAGDLWVQIPA